MRFGILTASDLDQVLHEAIGDSKFEACHQTRADWSSFDMMSISEGALRTCPRYLLSQEGSLAMRPRLIRPKYPNPLAVGQRVPTRYNTKRISQRAAVLQVRDTIYDRQCSTYAAFVVRPKHRARRVLWNLGISDAK